MSKYTTELRFICETQAGLRESVGYDGVSEVIKKARPKIFSFDYPIFDENYRPTLETKILRHFYTREIGLETYGLWKLHLEARLNEIMPYYNQLYESELIKFNPLYDTDIHTEGHRDENVDANGNNKRTGTDTTAIENKHNTWDLYSDTPQGGVNGIIGAEDDPSIAKNAYLTNARHTFGDTAGSTEATTYNSNTNNTSKTIGDTDYTEHVYGYRGRNPSVSLMEFRKTMLNIDMQVIKELEDLFFQLW